MILRKGGISEDQAPGVFAPEHPEFWLYPTWVHQADQGVRDGEASAAMPLKTDVCRSARWFRSSVWDTSKTKTPYLRSKPTTS